MKSDSLSDLTKRDSNPALCVACAGFLSLAMGLWCLFFFFWVVQKAWYGKEMQASLQKWLTKLFTKEETSLTQQHLAKQPHTTIMKLHPSCSQHSLWVFVLRLHSTWCFFFSQQMITTAHTHVCMHFPGWRALVYNLELKLCTYLRR